MCAMKRKRQTAREILAELSKKEEEAGSGELFKKRLIRVKIQTKPFSVFHGMGVFYCGYCGKPMALFSSRSFQPEERIPPLYYSCCDKCTRSEAHRTIFVDKLVLQLIQKRLTESLDTPKSEGDYKNLLETFKEIEELQSLKTGLLTKMHYASYKRENVLLELRQVQEQIDTKQKKVHELFILTSDENPLIYKMFTTQPDEIGELNLLYRRELVQLLITRIRFFNEFLILRMLPITDEDKQKSDEYGRTFNINLRPRERDSKYEPPPEVFEKRELVNELEDVSPDKNQFEDVDEDDLVYLDEIQE